MGLAPVELGTHQRLLVSENVFSKGAAQRFTLLHDSRFVHRNLPLLKEPQSAKHYSHLVLGVHARITVLCWLVDPGTLCLGIGGHFCR